MNYKNIFLIIMIFLFLFCLSYPLSVCCAEENEDNLMEFVEEIYLNYSQENFCFIYNKLHPGIKTRLSEKEYIKFQKENFQKYDLHLSDIIVEKNSNKIEIQDTFSHYIEDTEESEVLVKKVHYKMSFISAGQKIERNVSKEVKIFADREGNYYLLWDPEIVK